MSKLRVLFTFNNGEEFGTETDSIEAQLILGEWMDGVSLIEAGDYKIEGKDIQEIKFLR